MLNVFGFFLVVLGNFLIFYCIYLDLCDFNTRLKNEINNKSIKNKLHDPHELSNVYENLGGN